MFNRTVMYAKQRTPESLRVVARRAQLEAHNARLRLTVPVVARCEFTNIYHCAVRKTASQWVKALFSDPLVYRYCGLPTYDPRFYGWKHPDVVPRNRIGLSLFFPYARYEKMPKPADYRAFFVYRDPRDMIVSSYFSTLKSHGPMGDVLEVRRALQEKSKKDGLLFLIDDFARKGRFNAVRSWVAAPPSDEVRLFRYEDLTGERQAEQVGELMRHCGIAIPPDDLATLLTKYSFSTMNIKQGAGAVSHYRKGEPGDWVNHFDEDINDRFLAKTGDLVEALGYRA